MIPNARQADLLRFLCDRGSVPRDQIDGRVLRPLLSHGLATELAGRVRASDAGQALAARLSSEAVSEVETVRGATGRLSRAQEEFLRSLLRQTGPVLEDHVDGRVLRALRARGLVRSAGGWVTPTDAAAEQLASHSRHDRRTRTRRAAHSPQSGRAEALLRAVEQLEAAIPREAELLVGGHPAYADDVLAGLRRFAREMHSTPRASTAWRSH